MISSIIVVSLTYVLFVGTINVKSAIYLRFIVNILSKTKVRDLSYYHLRQLIENLLKVVLEPSDFYKS